MRRFFDDCAEGWDDRTGAFGAEHLAPLAAGLMAVEPEPERAIDIGTGTGAGALLVAREFPRARVRGVDLSEEMIRQAQARIGLDPEGRVAFKVADSSSLPYDDEHFDLVTLLNMPPFFAEIARVLRPGGHAVVAASLGPATPFYTPESVLRRGFERRGMEGVASGEAGDGTYFVARLPG
jgi:ubiquinone/menaquinone biosynthesis C-methylase UbiE